MTLSTRTRFEILKRDGFKCRYCGASAMQSVLHVDHVIAIAAGGTDDPANLVASCASCNLGKSDVPIEFVDQTRAGTAVDPELARAHAEQIRAYLAAQAEVEAARNEVRDWLDDQWRELVGDDPPMTLHRRWRALAQEFDLLVLLDAMRAVEAADWQLRGDTQKQTRYFHGVLRRRREGG